MQLIKFECFKSEDPDSHKKSLFIFYAKIRDFLDLQITQVKNENIFLSKLINNELPARRISKFQFKNLKKNEESTINSLKFEQEIIEKLQEAHNIIVETKKEEESKPSITQDSLKNNKIPPIKRAGSMIKPSSSNKHTKIIERKDKLQKSETLLKTGQNLVKNEKILKIEKIEKNEKIETKEKLEKIEKPIILQEKPEKIEPLAFFDKSRLKSALPTSQEKIALFFDLKKTFCKTKNIYLEQVANNSSKSQKEQNKFLSKLYSHYKEKLNVLKVRRESEFTKIERKKENSTEFSRLMYSSKVLGKKIYEIKNFVNLLIYYLNPDNTKELGQLDKTDGIGFMFHLWCLIHYFEENVSLVNKEIGLLFESYKKFANEFGSVFKEIIVFTKSENSQNLNNEKMNVFDYEVQENNKENLCLSIKMVDLPKFQGEIWNFNENVFKCVNDIIFTELFFKCLQEYKPKRNDPKLKGMTELLRFCAMMTGNNTFPIFYLKNSNVIKK